MRYNEDSCWNSRVMEFSCAGWYIAPALFQIMTVNSPRNHIPPEQTEVVNSSHVFPGLVRDIVSFFMLLVLHAIKLFALKMSFIPLLSLRFTHIL